MNVERLHRVARLILDELAENDTRGNVLRLRNGLEAAAVNPTDAQAAAGAQRGKDPPSADSVHGTEQRLATE